MRTAQHPSLWSQVCSDHVMYSYISLNPCDKAFREHQNWQNNRRDWICHSSIYPALSPLYPPLSLSSSLYLSLSFRVPFITVTSPPRRLTITGCPPGQHCSSLLAPITWSTYRETTGSNLASTVSREHGATVARPRRCRLSYGRPIRYSRRTAHSGVGHR